MSHRLLTLALIGQLGLLGLGCSAPGAPPPDPIDLGDPDCDPILPFECALPWPSSLYLKEDPSTKTGFALRFGKASLPATKQANTPVAPEGYQHLDGYSVGTPLIVAFPGLDASALPGENSIERSLDKDAQVLWFEVQGDAAARVPYFAELDGNEGDPERQVLFVRPAVILKEATRYVVAFRDLKDRGGAPIAPSPAFARLRDGTTRDLPALAARQARFDAVFSLLERQGVPRSSLTLAWDFVTGSSAALHGDLLAMRDDALVRAGARGAALQLTKVTEYAQRDDGSGRPIDGNWALALEGTYEVPDYLEPWTQGSFTGSRLRRGPDRRPVAMGTVKRPFWLRVPHSALSGPPHGLVMYGHGLLGSGTQVGGGFNGKIANDHKLIFFAADLTGMAEGDVNQVIMILQEMSRFPSMTDRLQQGLVQWVLLARGVREQLADLLASQPALSTKKIQVNKDELFYSGISQGGIFGASFLALSPDVTYGHLGVPGNNYSTLLQRSIDFTSYGAIIAGAYATTAEHAILLSAIQLLWDVADPVSHLRHITAEPYPGNRPHYGLWAAARGDYQVSVLTNEIAARSGLGIALLADYDKDRAPALLRPAPYPHKGSGLVLYHFGNPWPAPGNRPPKDDFGDPHGKPRKNDGHNEQMVHFFRTGEIIDACGGDGCYPN